MLENRANEAFGCDYSFYLDRITNGMVLSLRNGKGEDSSTMAQGVERVD